MSKSNQSANSNENSIPNIPTNDAALPENIFEYLSRAGSYPANPDLAIHAAIERAQSVTVALLILTDENNDSEKPTPKCLYSLLRTVDGLLGEIKALTILAKKYNSAEIKKAGGAE